MISYPIATTALNPEIFMYRDNQDNNNNQEANNDQRNSPSLKSDSDQRKPRSPQLQQQQQQVESTASAAPTVESTSASAAASSSAYAAMPSLYALSFPESNAARPRKSARMSEVQHTDMANQRTTLPIDTLGWWKFGEYQNRNELIEKISHDHNDNFYPQFSAPPPQANDDSPSHQDTKPPAILDFSRRTTMMAPTAQNQIQQDIAFPPFVGMENYANLESILQPPTAEIQQQQQQPPLPQLLPPPVFPFASLSNIFDEQPQTIPDPREFDPQHDYFQNLAAQSGLLLSQPQSQPPQLLEQHQQRQQQQQQQQQQRKRPASTLEELNEEDDSTSTPRSHKSDQEDLKFRSYQAENWTERFSELVEFRDRCGHCLVPNKYPQNSRLAQWVKRQRYQYKLKQDGKHSSMSDERVQALEEIGFCWDSHHAVWEERLDELLQYKEHYGDCNVPSRFIDNRKLAIWVKRQRRQYKFYTDGSSSSMTPGRIQILESVGFEWEVKKKTKKAR